MRNTSNRGNKSEAKVLLALIEQGYIVSQPFGSGHGYDLVVDDGQLLLRVQVKTAHLRNGCIVFNAYSMPGNGSAQRGYEGRADLFAAYCPNTNSVYLVPVRSVGANKVYLRVDPPANNQELGILWARNYEVLVPDAAVVQG